MACWTGNAGNFRRTRVSSEIRSPLNTPAWEAIEILEKNPFDVFDTIFIEDCVLNVHYSIAAVL